jgi:hypothetical protein
VKKDHQCLSGKIFKQLLTNFVSVKRFNCGDGAADYINDEVPSGWFERHRPQPRSVRPLGFGLCIKGAAKIIAATASI